MMRYEGEPSVYIEFEQADGEEVTLVLTLAALGW